MALVPKLGGWWVPSNSHQVTGYPLSHPWYDTHGLGSIGVVAVPQWLCCRILASAARPSAIGTTASERPCDHHMAMAWPVPLQLGSL